LNTSDEQFTYAKLNGSRIPNVPVYILTYRRRSPQGRRWRTLSSNSSVPPWWVKTQVGVANFKEFIPLGEGFELSVSVGSVVHPATKAGWDQVGVVPDVQVASDEALDRARALAKEKTTRPARKAGVQ
jgi:hypothetical protein